MDEGGGSGGGGPPTCGATNRAGVPCKKAPMRGRERCRNHGGKSTGALTSEGRQRVSLAPTKHGAYRQWSAHQRAYAIGQEEEFAAVDGKPSLEAELQFIRAKIATAQKVEAILCATHGPAWTMADGMARASLWGAQLFAVGQAIKAATAQKQLDPASSIPGKIIVEISVQPEKEIDVTPALPPKGGADGK